MAGMDSMDEFLKRCEKSGDSAYNAFKTLLEKLEDPITRTEARIFLANIQKRFDSDDASEQCLQTFHFRIHDIFLEDYQGYERRKKLTMMVIPSIFIPEDWSFTFYEGLNRHPESIFKDKTVAELGCGNGWISIALAEKWSPLKVYGLDINPRAVKVAWINLYLNALDENGQHIYDGEKKTLLDRVEFHESDLLSYCRDHNIELERIVGCIPQILNPNPEAMSKMITENASEEFLYSLSNYCALQGFVEDQFGLGLIARAVEEGIAVIKPMGIMIFNMGGRPGQAVCKRLFERRGFHVTKLWQTKVIQASDTDISALVEIEKNSRHRFEFFMGLAGDQPICARTAWAYGKAGGCISHALSVYSCQLRQPNQVKTILDFLKHGFQGISNSLDLSFDDDSVADEKIPFLAYLASALKENSFLLYKPPSGSTRFRNLIAGFMKTYHHVPLNANNVVVFPSRTIAIEDAFRLFLPRLAIVDEHLTKNLPKQWLTSLAIEGTSADNPSDDFVTVIEAPRQSDLMIELIKKLKPQVVVTGMAHFEAITSSAFAPSSLLNQLHLKTTANMQVKTLIFAAGLAAAAPQVTPTPAAPQVTPTPAADPTDGAFHLTTIHSGSEVHYSPFQAAQGRLSLKLPHNNASCDATTDGSATFYLGGINGDELFLYKNYNPPQQIYADRSAMGQGIVGYTTGAQPAPRNVELTRWAYDVDNGLTINGSGFLACPSADGSWALWVDAGVAQPAGYTGCLGIKARAFAEPNPVGCLYTQ